MDGWRQEINPAARDRGELSGSWNIWITYPVLAWAWLTAAHHWFVYQRKPTSEGEIEREMERQVGPSDWAEPRFRAGPLADVLGPALVAEIIAR